MEFYKEYIVQCISAAANNLRLSSEKIEVVAVIRENFRDCSNLEDEISRLKKITEFSRLAIKLGQVNNSLKTTNIDFLKISNVFKEHSYSIVKDLSTTLDLLSPGIVKEKIKRSAENNNTVEHRISLETGENKTDQNSIKENIIMQEDKPAKSDNSFDEFEKQLVNPVKEVDEFLKRIREDNYDYEEIEKYLALFKKNFYLSRKLGFNVITEMHETFILGLDALLNNKLKPDSFFIEGMRACLIVIVAVIRSKNVDISQFLKRSEELSDFLTKTE